MHSVIDVVALFGCDGRMTASSVKIPAPIVLSIGKCILYNEYSAGPMMLAAHPMLQKLLDSTFLILTHNSPKEDFIQLKEVIGRYQFDFLVINYIKLYR